MTVYKITANDEDVEIVEEQRDGDRYLVAKGVPIVKPMELSTGYVPEASIAQSTDLENTHGTTGWSGTTPTVNHPRNDPAFSWHDPSRPNDELVLAANDEVQATLGVGTVENDHWDGEYVRSDIAVNADKAVEMGGEAADIVDALEDDGPLEVSSQYLHAELPAGNYDGEYRENPKAIAAPDSVALIPNGRGVCSIEEGCGIAPGVTANVADYPASASATAADDLRNWGEGQRTRGTANVMQEQSTAAGVRQLLSGMASLLGATAGPTTDTVADAADDGGDGDGDGDGNGSDSDESAESDTDADADTTANTTMEDDKRQELIRFITANSELKEDSLEHMGDTCLENTHEMVVANAADDDGDGDDDSTDDDNTDTTADGDDGGSDADDGDTVDTADGLNAVMDRLESIEERMVTADTIDEHVETAANQLEAEERAKQIVANSAEYDEDDVEWIAELPEKELERKEQGVSLTGGLPAAGSPGFGASGNGDDVDTGNMPDLEVN